MNPGARQARSCGRTLRSLQHNSESDCPLTPSERHLGGDWYMQLVVLARSLGGLDARGAQRARRFDFGKFGRRRLSRSIKTLKVEVNRSSGDRHAAKTVPQPPLNFRSPAMREGLERPRVSSRNPVRFSTNLENSEKVCPSGHRRKGLVETWPSGMQA